MDSARIETTVAIVGGGPAGLMAAEILSAKGVAVHIFDAMPSLGRKFLMAGKSGLNLTHAEPYEQFVLRFGSRSMRLRPYLDRFTPTDLRDWAAGLGVETFVGSSGRVFPTAFKASPLLRAWLRRLNETGVQVSLRHKWTGWEQDGSLAFTSPTGPVSVRADATVFAFGAASWPRLGSDASWIAAFEATDVPIAPFRPANCGFNVNWSVPFLDRFAGEPVKSAVLRAGDQKVKGDFVISRHGIEGSAVYAVSAALRDMPVSDGKAILTVDLKPDLSIPQLADRLARPRGRNSLANHLRKVAGIKGVQAGLIRECLPKDAMNEPAKLAEGIKNLPIALTSTRPMAEAISCAGGVAFEALDDNLMLASHPGLFCAGEMLDWEAPTGGYLLTACFATGRAAGVGAFDWLKRRG